MPMGSTRAVGSRFQQPASIWVRRWFIKQILSMVNPAPLRLVSVYVASLKTWPPACKRRVEPAVCEIRPMILLLVFCLRQGGPSSSMESTSKSPCVSLESAPKKNWLPCCVHPTGSRNRRCDANVQGAGRHLWEAACERWGPKKTCQRLWLVMAN